MTDFHSATYDTLQIEEQIQIDNIMKAIHPDSLTQEDLFTLQHYIKTIETETKDLNAAIDSLNDDVEELRDEVNEWEDRYNEYVDDDREYDNYLGVVREIVDDKYFHVHRDYDTYDKIMDRLEHLVKYGD